ncbi:MAG TPA: endolytic transglycosylase MltG [Gemmatimonadales bacterium]|nr:endolytic transglycosylase MltG [Gemmatimonadales bacterium]
MTRRRLPAAALLVLACGGAPATAPRERVTIPAGVPFVRVTDSLAAHQVVTHPTWFRVLARLRSIDHHVQAGVYDIPRGASAWAVLDVLSSGRIATNRLTVPEGLTMMDVATLAATELRIPADSFLAAARDTAELRALGLDGPTFEGYLLPETYYVPVGTSARELVRMMGRQFLAAWQPGWDQVLARRGMTRRQAVTLASIVEGEARKPEERPVIAGVYTNRLLQGMDLQADPTVQYAIEMKRGRRKKRLFNKDYGFPSPYNTYLHPGLPPGPISSPGVQSLWAAVHPADVPYLYFVADSTGHHEFSATYAQHIRTIRRLRRR